MLGGAEIWKNKYIYIYEQFLFFLHSAPIVSLVFIGVRNKCTEYLDFNKNEYYLIGKEKDIRRSILGYELCDLWNKSWKI